MVHTQGEILLKTSGQGMYEFTGRAEAFAAESGLATGLLTIYCRHTSASLLIQENADPDVQKDLTEFFARLAPEHMDWLRHTTEGPDDMPAHMKAALTQTVLTVPIGSGRLLLGTWQGIFLSEHRHAPHERRIVLHAAGEA